MTSFSERVCVLGEFFFEERLGGEGEAAGVSGLPLFSCIVCEKRQRIYLQTSQYRIYPSALRKEEMIIRNTHTRKI